ncbi:putative 3-demethylubiquinone-9 3-methyltransferase (glyoxalase superfamily) [Herbihabitans rhizosphaerae]|uniref:Putative 3-demethylubiquinone-9 3-methyltransferase (Glyoxalase superfamily) n=1 Tax=Herbihabitans rhizosphaerae TaxID=1872711 RepID=A0A4Q7L7K9_9PSEU|nr:VOC family protein [Herbihabitans rhizosphaerae]RZS44880.1 putative 3-demethylubiquinone-9 3-methyltransferase (glyoxalase superfamily) [Herbihabitans rhizosphaerae]
MSSVSSYLWFVDNAEEVASYYTSLVKNSKVTSTMRGADGKVLIVEFELDGQRFIALNGGPHFTHSEAFSIFVRVDTQDEVDQLWNELTSNGGEESQCGWLKDRYGVSWQITPRVLLELVGNEDKVVAERAAQAMYKMRKIDIQKLVDAAKA